MPKYLVNANDFPQLIVPAGCRLTIAPVELAIVAAEVRTNAAETVTSLIRDMGEVRYLSSLLGAPILPANTTAAPQLKMRDEILVAFSAAGSGPPVTFSRIVVESALPTGAQMRNAMGAAEKWRFIEDVYRNGYTARFTAEHYEAASVPMAAGAIIHDYFAKSAENVGRPLNATFRPLSAADAGMWRRLREVYQDTCIDLHGVQADGVYTMKDTEMFDNIKRILVESGQAAGEKIVADWQQGPPTVLTPTQVETVRNHALSRASTTPVVVESGTGVTMAKIEAALEAVKQEPDVHRRLASKMFNVPYEQVTDGQRATARTMQYGGHFSRPVVGGADTQSTSAIRNAADLETKSITSLHDVIVGERQLRTILLDLFDGEGNIAQVVSEMTGLPKERCEQIAAVVDSLRTAERS